MGQALRTYDRLAGNASDYVIGSIRSYPENWNMALTKLYPIKYLINAIVSLSAMKSYTFVK